MVAMTRRGYTVWLLVTVGGYTVTGARVDVWLMNNLSCYYNVEGRC